jgi:hypothetical protein
MAEYDGHEFVFRQSGQVALDCEILFDGKPFICKSFDLKAEAGVITTLQAEIILQKAEIEIEGKRLVVKNHTIEENELSGVDVILE